MSGYKPLDDRQVINRASLPNIGSPTDDSLDDIFARIDAIIGGLSSGGGYVAKKAALTVGSTSLVVTLPAQPDTSYIILAMFGNTVDSFPQYQQVQVTAKSTSGFTFKWSNPLDSNNYFLSYIIPFKVFPEVEASIGSSVSTLSSGLLIPQANGGYPVIAQLQNLVDTNPEFQTVVVGSNTTTNANFKWNVNTDSSNYQIEYGVLGTGQVSIPNGVSSVSIPLPVNYNSGNYAVVATIQNTVDAFPQYQPMIITAQSGSSATISWNNLTDASSYVLNYYAISLTS